MTDIIYQTDGYKVDHRRQYPPGTSSVLSNFTARASRDSEHKSVTFFGLQYLLAKDLDEGYQSWFEKPRKLVLDEYQKFLDSYLGPNDVGTRHIAELHHLGHIPLMFRALPEGTDVPLRVPMFTIENTHPDFFWTTNYFETLISARMWQACTSATTAKRFRKLFDKYAMLTNGVKEFTQWQGHDFSFRGMAGPEAAALSGAGHLLSFLGTDTIPAIKLLEDYYGASGLIGGSVPATEHSVMCAGGKENEKETFQRLLKLYPEGIVSVVSDTWDLWEVIGTLLPSIREQVLARKGKLVIRPDSGDPVKILVGDPDGKTELERAGVVESLWNIFGGTVDEGFKHLDAHIGAIYGDSINEDRATRIFQGLLRKGFSSTNVVLGIGSYTYQYVTRDTHGIAIKATWSVVDGTEHKLFKAPKTDDGTKNSARGRLIVTKDLKLVDNLSWKEWLDLDQKGENLLQPVWADGQFLRTTTLEEIRQRVLA